MMLRGFGITCFSDTLSNRKFTVLKSKGDWGKMHVWNAYVKGKYSNKGSYLFITIFNSLVVYNACFTDGTAYSMTESFQSFYQFQQQLDYSLYEFNECVETLERAKEKTDEQKEQKTEETTN